MMWREHGWAAKLFSAFVEEVRYRAERPERRVIGALKRATG
jgi:hypothetical protein